MTITNRVLAAYDTLYENTAIVEHGKRRPFVREWTVLHVYVDTDYTNDDGSPIQILTMRAETNDGEGYRYQAMMDVEVESKIAVGLWSRVKPT